jgi:hypothetical protein
MKIFSFLLFLFPYSLLAQITPYELNGKNYTSTYKECISYYQSLTQQYKGIALRTIGSTDAGLPLHLVCISADGILDPKQWQNQKKTILLINNGIHPGEPDGIDASMMLARDVLKKIKANQFPKNIAIALIPVYNIGGMLNRSPYYRIDQNGPEEFGSRGNSQNLDLNRDFIKCDSKEARSFAEIFHLVNPHIFIDNHVSDGADYPYVMTLANTQKDKLGGILSDYLSSQLEPEIYRLMKDQNFPMIPYVNAWGRDARSGWPQFFDSPRYSSGYAALWNTLSFVPETHMLKSYDQRVSATYTLMQCFLQYASKNSAELILLKKKSIENMLIQENFPIAWKNDKTIVDSIHYSGYTYKKHKSAISDLQIGYYDHKDPYIENIPFYNHYTPTIDTKAPLGYIIPQGWHKVIELLKINRVKMIPFTRDTSLYVQAYRIKNYKSSNTPYEGHHANSQVEVTSGLREMNYRKGDIYIPLQQNAKRFLIETLEPHAMDSYFSWNFFDAILNQKEGFTDYAFDEKAAEILNNDPILTDSFNARLLSDTTFAHDHEAQLDYLYKHSSYYEMQHNLYPVARVVPLYITDKESPTQEDIMNKKDE